MDSINYHLTYIVSNIFDTFIIYKFMGIFFDRVSINKKIEILSYIGYLVILTLVTSLMNIAIVLIMFNILAFTALTYNYKASFKRRLLSAILMYVSGVFIETIGVLLSGCFIFSVFAQNPYIPLKAMIIIKTVSYILIFIVDNFFTVRKKIDIPATYWICICLIPFSLLFCFIILLQANLNLLMVITFLILLLIINFSVLNLYNVITAAYDDRTTQLLLSQQNKYYNNQFELMKTSLKAKNAEKHDLKNHLSVIETLVQKNEKERVSEHIAMMMDICVSSNEYAHSGNTVIDSILNYKLLEAEQQGIIVNLELTVPEYLNVSSYDMTVILGNILDNAINATKKLEVNRKIDLKIKYDKCRLLIKLNNLFDGQVICENGKLLTSNKDKDNHGIGLSNVQSVLKKYNGRMKIEHSGNSFLVVLLMFV